MQIEFKRTDSYESAKTRVFPEIYAGNMEYIKKVISDSYESEHRKVDWDSFQFQEISKMLTDGYAVDRPFPKRVADKFRYRLNNNASKNGVKKMSLNEEAFRKIFESAVFDEYGWFKTEIEISQIYKEALC